ncbi:MAG TPA: YafY family protein [Blastocatellia bacterium]|nr:YafY family protein [Blastocatellia bacterium]
MRADRLLSILLLLQVHRRLTARDLATRLEVSERTIHRDMEALSAAGFPVFAERGIGGGWMLVEGYRTNLTGLNRDEIQALFLTKPLRLLADLGLKKASDAAFIKLSAALPAAHRDNAEQARQRIHIDATGWNHSSESIQFLPVLQEAVWQERKLRFTYERGGGCDSVERLADPLGLVAKGSAWYLVAAVDGEIRSYRVSRVVHAELTDDPCARPADFDLAGYWEQSTVNFKAQLPQYTAIVRVHPDVFPRLRFAGRFARIGQAEPPDADGWIRVTLRFDVEEMAIEWALSFGSNIEVLEPATLREQVIAAADSVLTFYAQTER